MKRYIKKYKCFYGKKKRQSGVFLPLCVLEQGCVGKISNRSLVCSSCITCAPTILAEQILFSLVAFVCVSVWVLLCPLKTMKSY